MKTKIIYISGNEFFEMADIRAAFEEVRTALGLDNDTVLFGVPVDAADALADANMKKSDITAIETEPVVDEVAVIAEPVEIIEPVINVANDEIKEPATDVIESEPVDTPKKKSRGRPKKVVEVAPEIAETPIDEPADAPVIPILSVLGTSSISADSEPVADVAESEPESEPDTELSAVDIESIAEPVIIDAEPDVVETTTAETVELDNVDTIEQPIAQIESEPETNMIQDAAPVESTEPSLEELLERMTPLGEDAPVNPFDDEDNLVVIEQTDTASNPVTSDDSDATLEKLASEFAEKQDTIVAAPKSEGRGKIGKLKNILPFKKAKRDDTGLMGDLFGWAGIAANDEDFSMPGFFTGVASKK